MQPSVFAKYQPEVFQYTYRGELVVDHLAGGIPSDPRVAEGWLRTKLGLDADNEALAAMVIETLVDRGLNPADRESLDEAVSQVVDLKHLNGFKRNRATDELYVEGRQLKSCIKEAANIRWPKDTWGPSHKGTKGFFAEHVFVLEDELGLGVKQASGIEQRFVHTFRGNGIQYAEYVTDAHLNFTVTTDFAFSDAQWGQLWVTAEFEGLGASRSQGFGRFAVTAWERV